MAVLRRLRPEVAIDWLVRPPYAELVRKVRALRHVWELEGQKRALGRALRSVGYDWATDFQGLGRSAWWTWWSGANQRLGFRGRDLREVWARVFYNRVAPGVAFTDGAVHVVDRNVRLLRGLGYSTEVLSDGLTVFSNPAARWELLAPESPETVERVRAVLPNEPFWVLQPDASRPWKQWSVAAYGRLARLIVGRTGRPGLILWSPGGAERARAIAAEADDARVRPAPAWGWGACALAFREARVVIGPDTGMVHWADWVGTPVVMWVVRSGRWVTAETNGPYFTRARSRTLEVTRGAEPVEAVAEAVVALLEG